jgi:hypothetical protein
VTRQDAGAASGQQVYPPLTRCVCGELITVHMFDSKGRRAACSYSNCRSCPGFTEEESES